MSAKNNGTYALDVIGELVDCKTMIFDDFFFFEVNCRFGKSWNI